MVIVLLLSHVAKLSCMLNSNLHAGHLQFTFNELNPTNTPGWHLCQDFPF